MERPNSSLGWQSRLELPSRSLIATLPWVPQRTRQRKQLELLSLSLIDVTGFSSKLVQLDEVSNGDRGDGDI
jgi:hypothetical protein